MTKRKMQKPINRQRWNKQIKFYHNKTSKHFFLGMAKRGNKLAGHDMTTHPTLNNRGLPKKKYLLLVKNPNPHDNRNSYVDKKLRLNVNIYFFDTNQKRLKIKKKWKLDKQSLKILWKVDKKSIKNKNPH